MGLILFLIIPKSRILNTRSRRPMKGERKRTNSQTVGKEYVCVKKDLMAKLCVVIRITVLGIHILLTDI